MTKTSGRMWQFFKPISCCSTGVLVIVVLLQYEVTFNSFFVHFVHAVHSCRVSRKTLNCLKSVTGDNYFRTKCVFSFSKLKKQRKRFNSEFILICRYSYDASTCFCGQIISH